MSKAEKLIAKIMSELDEAKFCLLELSEEVQRGNISKDSLRQALDTFQVTVKDAQEAVEYVAAQQTRRGE